MKNEVKNQSYVPSASELGKKDDKAWREIIAHWKPRANSRAIGYVGYSNSEDVVNDVIASVFQRSTNPQLPPLRDENILGYLDHSLTNRVRSRHRKEAHPAHPVLLFDMNAGSVDKPNELKGDSYFENQPDKSISVEELVVEANFHEKELKRLMEIFPEDSKLPRVLLMDVEGYSYKEIAEEMGIPVSTVGTRLHRAKQKVRDRAEEVFDHRVLDYHKNHLKPVKG